MRALSPQEERALAVLLAPWHSQFDASTPEGAYIDAGCVLLVDRGCAIWRRRDDGSVDFGPTERGRLAWRVSRIPR